MVKLFHHRRHDDLAILVQSWLEANSAIYVVGMTSSSSSYGHTVTLICEPGEVSRGYRFVAFFGGLGFTGPQIEVVEEDAQAWLSEGGRLVHAAQSQNDMGLFLALLIEAA